MKGFLAIISGRENKCIYLHLETYIVVQTLKLLKHIHRDNLFKLLLHRGHFNLCLKQFKNKTCSISKLFKYFLEAGKTEILYSFQKGLDNMLCRNTYYNNLQSRGEELFKKTCPFSCGVNTWWKSDELRSHVVHWMEKL